jgi:hypothetical protein
MDRNNDAPERPAMMSPQRFRFFLFGGMMLMFVVGALVLLFHPPYGIVLVQGVTAAYMVGLVGYVAVTLWRHRALGPAMTRAQWGYLFFVFATIAVSSLLEYLGHDLVGDVVLLGLAIYMWARTKITLRRLNPEDKG